LSARILTREVDAQIHADGGTKEQAMSYHLFVLGLHLAAGLSGRAFGHDLPASFWAAVERMMDFAAALGAGGPLAAYGDADDGYVLDVGQHDNELGAALGIGAVLFGRDDYLAVTDGCGEPVRWLCGAPALERVCASRRPRVALASRSLPDSGYYLLQRGT